MSPVERAAIRMQHTDLGQGDFCVECAQVWPCLSIRLLSELENVLNIMENEARRADHVVALLCGRQEKNEVG